MAPVSRLSLLRDASSALAWNLRLWRQRVGRRQGPAAVVLALALGAMAALGAWDYINQREMATLGKRERQLPNRAFLPPERVSDAIIDEASQTREQMAAFERGLPSHDEVGEALASIVKLADARHLVLAHGEYRDQPDDLGLFAGEEMVLPVSGEASAVQGFISDVLHAQPYLALEHLHVQRSSNVPGTVDVQLRWRHFTRPAPSHDVRGARIMPVAEGHS